MSDRSVPITSIRGSRRFVGGEVKGKHKYAPCSRCGRVRQVNANPVHEDGLCPDCRSTDPFVWAPSQHSIWDGEEEDHAHAS